MDKETLTFGDIEFEKDNFTTVKVLVSTKGSSDKKNYNHTIGYLYNDYNVRPLEIMLPLVSAYVKS